MYLVCDTASLLAGERALPKRLRRVFPPRPSKAAQEAVRRAYHHIFREPIAWCKEQGIGIEWIYPLGGDGHPKCERLAATYTPGDLERSGDRCAIIKFSRREDDARWLERWGEVFVVTQNGSRVVMEDDTARHE